MSTQPITGIRIGVDPQGETGKYTNFNSTIDTSGKVQQRIDNAIAEIGDDFVLLHPEESSGVQEITGNEGLKVGGTLQSTGNFDVGDNTTGANAKVWGTMETTGATTSGGALTVSSGGATITGNSSITGTLSSSDALTVSSGGATITGNSSITGTLTSSNTLTVSSGGASITGNSTITGTTTSTGNLTVGGTGSGENANATINGDITASGLITGNVNITVPSSGGGITFPVITDEP